MAPSLCPLGPAEWFDSERNNYRKHSLLGSLILKGKKVIKLKKNKILGVIFHVNYDKRIFRGLI